MDVKFKNMKYYFYSHSVIRQIQNHGHRDISVIIDLYCIT